MAARQSDESVQPEAGGYRDHSWYHPRRLMLDLVGVIAAAVATQMVIPGIVPYCQLKLYQVTGFDFEDAQYIAVASHQDLAGDPKQAKIEFNRVFCGFSFLTAKSCLMHRVLPVGSEAPSKWRFDKSPVKDVLLGDRASTAFIAWISEKSGTGGSGVAEDYSHGTYVGFGIACTKNYEHEQGKPYPVKVLYGNLPKEFDDTMPANLEDLRASVADLMTTTKISVELKEGPPKACESKGKLPDLKRKPDLADGMKQAWR